MDYNKEIEKIVNEAITTKTFNLEIIEKIKSLKDEFEKIQEELKETIELKIKLEKDNEAIRGENGELKKDLSEFRTREKEIRKKEKKAEKREYELDFQKMRADEIKELFGMVFKNPVILRNKTTSVPIKDNNGYMTTAGGSENEREEIGS